MFKYELFTRVALGVDLPENRLVAGDVATIVERLEPNDLVGEPGYCLEVFDSQGGTIAVITMLESELQPFPADTIYHLRSLIASSELGAVA